MPYILKEKISKYTLLYINNILVKRLATQYEQKNGTYKMFVSNTGIRKFIFEYLYIVNKILQ